MNKSRLIMALIVFLMIPAIFIFTGCTPGGWGGGGNTSDIGRYEVFSSDASNLVEGVDNGYRQIYMRDRQTGEITLVSVGIDGEPASGDCTGGGGTRRASISADGRYVVFDSDATNLVDIEFQGEHQVYVRDIQEGVTTLVSLGYDGKMGDYCAKEASISADGSYIVYSSSSSNILDGVAGTSLRQIFLYARATGTTTLVSANSDGNQGNKCSRAPVISADGRYVAFDSNATNLLADAMPSGASYIYLRNIESGVITLVSVGYDGNPSNGYSYYPSISADGRYVAFHSSASNLVDGVTGEYQQIYLRDMQEEVTTLVSVGYDGNPGNNYSYNPSVSADGRYVAFYSGATNLMDGVDTGGYQQIYLRDMQAEVTTLISVGYDGNPGDTDSYGPLVSADGGRVYFYSAASNLMEGVDSGEYYQVYAWDLAAGTTAIISVNSSGEAGNADSYVRD